MKKYSTMQNLKQVNGCVFHTFFRIKKGEIVPENDNKVYFHYVQKGVYCQIEKCWRLKIMPMLDMPVKELEKYNGTNPKPADHDAYWEKAIAEMTPRSSRRSGRIPPVPGGQLT